MKSDYLLNESCTIPLIRFPHFTEAGLKAHGITTRRGGVSEGALATLNMGRRGVDADEYISENHRRVAEALGVSPGSFVFSDQVHGARIHQVTSQNRLEKTRETDGLMTDVPGVTLVTLYADCMPILVYDPIRRAIGMVHAGWRGTAKAIGPALVRQMNEAYGSKPEHLLAAIGPAIGKCCFEVGDEVVHAFKDMEALLPETGWLAWHEGSPHVDLIRINTTLLTAAGLNPLRISVAPLCTRCHGELLYSHRRDHGQTGRMAALMAL